MASIDVQGLNNQFLKNNHNFDEAVRKWRDFVFAPAGNIPVEYYDDNGNLIQLNIPNKNKLVNDFIANVNSAMSKTFYVDAINGDDNNDGSQSTPFQSITKAINSVPIGGAGLINLANNQIHTINEGRIDLHNKLLYFRSIEGTSTPGQPDDNSPVIYFPSNGSGNLAGFFAMRKSVVIFGDYYRPVKVKIGNLTEEIWDAVFRGDFIPLLTGWGALKSNNFVIFSHSQVDISPRCKLTRYIDLIRFRSTKVKIHSADTFGIISLEGDTCTILEVSSSQITDINGNNVTTSIVSPIIRDSNGVPRNILSNIVF